MSLPGFLCSFGLKQLFDVSSSAVADWVDARFDDASRGVVNLVIAANRRAWDVLDAALAPPTFVGRLRGRLKEADFRAARDEVQKLTGALPADVRERAAQQLAALGSANPFGAQLDAAGAVLKRFAEPAALAAEVDRAAATVSDALAAHAPDLAAVVGLASGGAPLFQTLYRYHFRKLTAKNAELSGLLQHDQLRALADLTDTRTAGVLDQLDVLFDSLDAQFAGVNAKLDDIRGKLDRLIDERNVPTKVNDPLRVSVTNEREHALLRKWRDELQQLPAEMVDSALLTKLGDALAASRLFAEAQQAHEAAAKVATDTTQRAEAEYKAFRDASEREQWEDALPALVRAAELAPERFAPFPLTRYEPEGILGVGGFATVVRCRDKFAKGRTVAVKAFHTAELGRDVDDVFAEAHTLSELDAPGVVKVRHWDFADPQRSRPFLVMDYFPGVSLAVWLKENGPLPLVDFLEVARQTATALAAAHAKGVLHRDVKPGNVLVRRLDSGAWDVRVIDFGLAVRLTTAHASVSTAAPHRTRRDLSFAGSLEYASPEQKGAIAAPVGPRSDVYSYGKTMLEALLATTEPVSDDWSAVPDPLRRLLEKCVVRDPARRHDWFAPIVAGLPSPGAPKAGSGEELPFAEVVEEPPAPAPLPRETAVERVRRIKRQAAEKNARARELFERHDYAGAVAVFRAFAPEEVPDRDDDLLARAAETRDRLVALDASIHALVEQSLGRDPQLPELLAESLQLNPANAEWRELADELQRERTEAERREAERKRRAEEAERRRKAEEEAAARDPFHPKRERNPGQTLTVKLPGDVPLTLAWCPLGSSRMGSENGYSDEKPVHTVRLTQGFFAGIYPVTQAQWKAVMGTDPSHFKGADRPVENVSWDDAQGFCQKLQEMVRKSGSRSVTVRLPTEAEWEYACRAGTTSDYWSGSDETALRRAGWFAGNSPGQTQPVGKLAKNAWGLYDVHGNVWEWCQDNKRTYTAQDQVDPIENSNEDSRVLRGGSWSSGPVYCRAAFRFWLAPATRDGNFGFRVCFRLD